MIDEVQQLLDEYWRWLKDRTVLRDVGDWIELTTPFVDRHNDRIQLYVSRTSDGYLLTDDGATIRDLRMSGTELNTPKREQLLNLTLSGFGIHRDGDALIAPATPETFGLRKHNLLQGVLAVNDLFYLSEPVVASLFIEDVTQWLDSLRVRYVQRTKVTGVSGYDHVFDFVIPRSELAPERFVRVMNRPSKESAEAAAFAWIDSRNSRQPEAKAFAVINDAERTVSPQVSTALRSYSVVPIIWSRRREHEEELAA